MVVRKAIVFLSDNKPLLVPVSPYELLMMCYCMKYYVAFQDNHNALDSFLFT